MREHETRRERHHRKIMLFLASSDEKLLLKLYGNEITSLLKCFPQIQIQQGSQGTDKQFDCTITKVKI